MTHYPRFPSPWGLRLHIFLQVAVRHDWITRSTQFWLLLITSPKWPSALIPSKWLWFLGTTHWNFRHCGNEEKWMVIFLVLRLFGCFSNHAVVWTFLSLTRTASLSPNHSPNYGNVERCVCWLWQFEFFSYSFEATLFGGYWCLLSYKSYSFLNFQKAQS